MACTCIYGIICSDCLSRSFDPTVFETWLKGLPMKTPFEIGDVVVFKDPADPTNPQRYVVCRVSKGDYIHLDRVGGGSFGALADHLELLDDWIERRSPAAGPADDDDLIPAKLSDTETWFQEAERIVSGNRQQDYGPTTGDAEDTTLKIAAAWSTYLGVEITGTMFCDLMILLKLMRESHKEKRDNNVDIAGYLLLKEKHS